MQKVRCPVYFPLNTNKKAAREKAAFSWRSGSKLLNVMQIPGFGTQTCTGLSLSKMVGWFLII